MVTITFSKPYSQYKDNDADWTAFRYPFTVTRHASDPKYDKVTEHTIEVSASHELTYPWGYSDSELERVLFEYGRQHIFDNLKKGQLQDFEELKLNTQVSR